MNKLTFALVSALAVSSIAACKKKDGAGGGGAGAAMAKMAELRDEMCKCNDAKCAQEVSDRMAKWSQEQSEGPKGPPTMSEEETKRAAEIGEELGKCMQRAMAAGAAAPPGDPDEPAGEPGASAPEGVPAECAEYKAAIDKLAACDRMPESAREALVKAYNDAAAGWANLPEGAKANLPASCKAGADAVMAAAKTACGW